jgi:predicted aminopeptidase
MMLLAPLAAILIASLGGCVPQTGYLAKQGTYLLHYSTGTRPVQSLVADPATPLGTRDFLRRVQDIRQFAFRAVGLKDKGNYTRYRDMDRDHLVDVVSACDALSFAPYLWRYPLLGPLPYKGFYERPDADAEAARLRKDGWDVVVRPVDAFSTLGFAKDPLYSFMKTYSSFELASLIIHEQTHATLFIRGQPDFNEELATFVGDEGAFEWLRARYGEDSREYRDARDSYEDSQTFTAFLKDLSQQLDTMYKGGGSRDQKLAEKARMIAGFTQRLGGDLAPRFHTEGYRNLGTLRINNAYLSLYSLYSDDIPLLRQYWQTLCGSSLPRFMDAAVRLAKQGDVKALMKKELSGG